MRCLVRALKRLQTNTRNALPYPRIKQLLKISTLIIAALESQFTPQEMQLIFIK